jgi:hypothetical protein
VYTQIYILRFPKETSDQPFIYRLVKEYDIEFNILKADILLQREGLMIIELKGTSKTNVKAGLDYLRHLGVKIERMAARIRLYRCLSFRCSLCCTSGYVDSLRCGKMYRLQSLRAHMPRPGHGSFVGR